MSAQLLTTGKVAQRCSVKPDTVLKWIKKGRLRAVRTMGGHFRVDERDLVPLLENVEDDEDRIDNAPACAHPPLRCWEYMSDDSQEECQTCSAFRVHAAWCFQLVKLTHAAGHNKKFCTGSCLDCPYYRRTHGLPTNVLVLTRDQALIQRIANGNHECLAFRYARTGYDASAIMSVFRPALVVVDEYVLSNGDAGLVEALAADPRIPGVRILIGAREGSTYSRLAPAGQSREASPYRSAAMMFSPGRSVVTSRCFRTSKGQHEHAAHSHIKQALAQIAVRVRETPAPTPECLEHECGCSSPRRCR